MSSKTLEGVIVAPHQIMAMTYAAALEGQVTYEPPDLGPLAKRNSYDALQQEDALRPAQYGMLTALADLSLHASIQTPLATRQLRRWQHRETQFFKAVNRHLDNAVRITLENPKLAPVVENLEKVHTIRRKLHGTGDLHATSALYGGNYSFAVIGTGLLQSYRPVARAQSSARTEQLELLTRSTHDLLSLTGGHGVRKLDSFTRLFNHGRQGAAHFDSERTQIMLDQPPLKAPLDETAKFLYREVYGGMPVAKVISELPRENTALGCPVRHIVAPEKQHFEAALWGWLVQQAAERELV